MKPASILTIYRSIIEAEFPKQHEKPRCRKSATRLADDKACQLRRTGLGMKPHHCFNPFSGLMNRVWWLQLKALRHLQVGQRVFVLRRFDQQGLQPLQHYTGHASSR